MTVAPEAREAGPTGVYRDARDALQQRRQRLLRRHRAALERFGEGLATLYSRRVARVAAGVVALSGAGMLYAAVAVSLFARGPCRSCTSPEGSLLDWAVGCPVGIFSWLLLGTPVVAAFAYLGARAVASLYVRSVMRESLQPGDDLHGDVARLEREGPAEIVREASQPLELASLALPLVAVALLGPLSIHYLAASLSQVGGVSGRDFDQWIRLSLALVGHCHLVLGWLAWRFACRLAAGRCQHVSAEAWRAWGITLATSAVPGVVLLAVPVLMVALTGAVFIPALFGRMARTWARERELLGQTRAAGAAGYSA